MVRLITVKLAAITLIVISKTKYFCSSEHNQLVFGFTLILGFILMFAIGCKQNAPESVDGNRAFDHVKNLVAFGPHPSGSKFIEGVQTYIKNHLKQNGLQIIEYDFIAHTPIGHVPMKNIVGILSGEKNSIIKTNDIIAKDIIMIATHYETKYFTEFDFVGANDGCSGAGLLLELCTTFSKARENINGTIWFVFFDGEEAFLNWSPSDSLYGSRYLVKELQNQGKLSQLRALILLDMIGDKELTICRETYSTKWLQDLVWEVARNKNYQNYFRECSLQVMDDHFPFLQAGVPAIDIIDFQYGGNISPGKYWHTPQDTLDKVCAKSLNVVGEVVYQSVFRIQSEFEIRK